MKQVPTPACYTKGKAVTTRQAHSSIGTKLNSEIQKFIS